MNLPNGHIAYIDDTKLIDYCLSAFHPIGKHKATVFKSALDFSISDFQELKQAILEGILTTNAKQTAVNKYGILYLVDVRIQNPPKEAVVRTSWIIKFEENYPRLTSCYVIN